MCVVADKRVVMMAVWKDSIEVETMVPMMGHLKDWRRVAVKASSMAEWTVLIMIERLVVTTVDLKAEM